MTAREQLGLVAVLCKQREGLVGRPGLGVVERGGDHFAPPDSWASRAETFGHASTAWPEAASTAFTMLW